MDNDAVVRASVKLSSYITTKEHAQIIKARAQMLQKGETPLVDVLPARELDDEMVVAFKELHTGALNHVLCVERMFPDGAPGHLLYRAVNVPLHLLKLKDDY